MSQDELNKFYKLRLKKPSLYTYNDNGDLIELNKEGNVINTITLPEYRKPTYEEYDSMEEKRMQMIAEANKEYEDARRELRELTSKIGANNSDILRLNRKVSELDIKLQSIRFPLRYIEEIKSGIEIKDIDFNSPNEKRKYQYPFYILKTAQFNLQDQYVRIGKEPEKPLLSVIQVNKLMNQQLPVILFSEPTTNDYGFLSLKWAVQIEYNSTVYNSVHQAISAELAKKFNDTDNLQKIMIAETPDEIVYTVSNVPGDIELNETKWNAYTKQLLYDINIAKFNQYPELASRLIETQNAIIGAYLPNDNLIGIGISLDNIQSKNPVNWSGQNILGKALMDIRNKLREERQMKVQLLQQTEDQEPRTIRRKKRPVVSTT